MDEINKLRELYKLKKVDRASSVRNRKENSAEHSWSCLILADYFYEKYNYDFDLLKVFELLLYHDVVEIINGDAPLHKTEERKEKKKTEKTAAIELGTKLPMNTSSKYLKLFNEYEAMQTIESKFAKAIDALDPIIHELDYKEDWKGWTKQFLIDKKLKYFKEFPDLEKEFYKLLEYLEDNGYLNQ